MLTLGSLFDGIGVFPLAASRHGIVPLWASEIEKAPVSVTKRQFPGMAYLGDITKLHGGKIPAVDIITFGSPCQNLSTAGGREGLAGRKSSLFYEAIRLIQEMRETTNGLHPIIAVWENVMGAFSSNNRMDFRAVLESFADTHIPMPASGRWANAGMVRGRSPDVAWRLMDARTWGVPQRRKRIFIVADFRGQRAAEILFKPSPLFKNTGAGAENGLSAAAGNRIPAETTRRPLPVVHPFQDRRMRGAAKAQDPTAFIGSFGKPTDPFPTLLAGTVNMFAYWTGGDYKNGILRYLTPTECERLMGLPDGWTALGCKDEPISTGARYKALGNAIVLPCAEYIMAGIAEILKGG
ncbi:MAG: DNA cytosine methyltransferase [Syntrophomonadaceae bacterium]